MAPRSRHGGVRAQRATPAQCPQCGGGADRGVVVGLCALLCDQRRAHLPLVIVINLALAAMALTVPAAHRVNELLGGLIIIVTEVPALFALVAILGRDSGIQLNLIVGAAAAFFIFGGTRPILGVITVVACFAAHVAAWFWFPVGLIPVESGFLAQLYVGSAINVFVLIGALTFYSFRL